MGKIRIVLLFDEENEKQRQAGEFLKTQKRCKMVCSLLGRQLKK